MTNPILASSAHPNQEFYLITQLGLRAVNLMLTHKDVIEPRLPAGTLDGLTNDLSSFGVAIPGAVQTRAEARVATAEQLAAQKKGHARIQAVRDAVRRSDAPAEVKKAYGVGEVVDPRHMRSVSSVLKQILDRAAEHPEEAAKIGILQKDLDAMNAAHKALHDADDAQDLKRVSAPLSTKERNRTANRILKGVARIAGAGALEFVEDPELQKEFKALRPAPKSKKSASVKGQPKPGSGATKETTATATNAPAVTDAPAATNAPAGATLPAGTTAPPATTLPPATTAPTSPKATTATPQRA